MHGNNKSDDELRAAAEAGALVVVDSLEEVDRARAAGVTRTLIRVTPGVEADTHEQIRTGHHGSKFGLPPDDALEALRRAPETEGLHVHVGSQLLDAGAALMAVDWLATFAARARAETGWEPRTIDLGGGLGVADRARRAPARDRRVRRARCSRELERACELQGLPRPQVILEPGRSLVARAGVTLYTVGSVKRASATRRPTSRSTAACPTTRAPRSTAPATPRCSRTAPDEPPTGAYAVAGKHCESGDLLIERVELPEPRRGDILAVPGDRRLHARDELELQRRAAPGRRARARRRGDA